MSRKANPTLIGIFVLGALVLAVVIVLLLAGGQWFQERRQHVMYFEGAAQGLQEGSPVVFLGVKVGTVKRIQLGLDEKSRRFLVPVTIEIDQFKVQTHSGENVDLRNPETIKKLVQQGLRAQLKVQSLLTGQLYIDLDFHPDKKARFFAADPKVSEIPTIPTTVEVLTSMLEGFPVDEFLNDLSTISDSVKELLSSEAIRRIPPKLETTLDHLQTLTAKVENRADPLLDKVDADLGELRLALEGLRKTMAKVGSAAGRVGDAADRVGNAADAVPGALDAVSGAGQELKQAARRVRNLTGEETPTVQRLNAALADISRAARALRLLAETLEQQPEAIWRGKQSNKEQR